MKRRRSEDQLALFDIAKGRQLRDDGIARALAGQSSREWIAWAKNEALRIVSEQGTVDADRVRLRCPIPESLNPKICGAVFLQLAREGHLEPFGITQTARHVAHGRGLRVWQATREERNR